MAHVAKYKKEVVKEFSDLIRKYPIIGALNMENMPAAQLQRMRSQLRGNVHILMSKRRLIKLAIEECKNDKKGIKELEKYLEGMPALIFTTENPFRLYNKIQKSKSAAPAKAGQKAPRDIIIPAGPTAFAPGPVISELASVGIKTGVEAGKVAVKQDSVVAKEGAVISAKLAGILTRLGIEPMEIGLDVVAVYENGVIYPKKVLAIDEEQYKSNITQAASWAFNLAIEAVIFTKDTTETLLQKAFRESKAVALESNFMADAVAEELVEKAEREMLSLKSEINVPNS